MSKKNRLEEVKKILKEAFEYQEYTIDELNRIVGIVFPIFGELKINKEEIGNGYIIKYIDYDVCYIDKLENGTQINKEIDMSSTVLNLELDTEGNIKIVNHNYQIFTPANKLEVLFTASLIGKKIIM